MALFCGVTGADDGEWWWSGPNDYSTASILGRRKRCCSCEKIITGGEVIGYFDRWRSPRGFYEERVYGGEVPLAPYVMCERCLDLYFSLSELGYSFNMPADMRELVKEYRGMFVQEAERKALAAKVREERVQLRYEATLFGCLDSSVVEPLFRLHWELPRAAPWTNPNGCSL